MKKNRSQEKQVSSTIALSHPLERSLTSLFAFALSLGAALTALRTLLTHLISTLETTPLGGFPLPSPSGAAPPPATGAQVQQLFQERIRVKEGAEIAGGVLGST